MTKTCKRAFIIIPNAEKRQPLTTHKRNAGQHPEDKDYSRKQPHVSNKDAT
jgi:hypothetical protein